MKGPLPARHHATALSPAAFTARTSMPSNCSPGMLKETPRLEKIGLSGGTRYRCAHGVTIVFDDVDHGELPQLRHVEAFVDLALVRGAVPEISQTDRIVAAITIGESKPGAE